MVGMGRQLSIPLHSKCDGVRMSIAQQLEAAIVAKGLTLYGAAQFIGAKSDLPLKTVYRRLADLQR